MEIFEHFSHNQKTFSRIQQNEIEFFNNFCLQFRRRIPLSQALKFQAAKFQTAPFQTASRQTAKRQTAKL